MAQLGAEARVAAQRRRRAGQHAEEVGKLAGRGHRALEDGQRPLGSGQVVVDLEAAHLRLHGGTLVGLGRTALPFVSRRTAVKRACAQGGNAPPSCGCRIAPAGGCRRARPARGAVRRVAASAVEIAIRISSRPSTNAQADEPLGPRRRSTRRATARRPPARRAAGSGPRPRHAPVVGVAGDHGRRGGRRRRARPEPSRRAIGAGPRPTGGARDQRQRGRARARRRRPPRRGPRSRGRGCGAARAAAVAGEPDEHEPAAPVRRRSRTRGGLATTGARRAPRGRVSVVRPRAGAACGVKSSSPPQSATSRSSLWS